MIVTAENDEEEKMKEAGKARMKCAASGRCIADRWVADRMG